MLNLKYVLGAPALILSWITLQLLGRDVLAQGTDVSSIQHTRERFVGGEAVTQTSEEWLRESLPNVELMTHTGETVRFYDDLIKGKTVIINFMYTCCTVLCPIMTSNLKQVQELLGDRVGRDITMVSLTLDAKNDTPEKLASYAERYDIEKGWVFCTGDYDDIEALRFGLGIYDPDPLIDADKTQHAGVVVFGHEPSGRWASLPVLIKPKQLAEGIMRLTGDSSDLGHVQAAAQEERVPR